jgi:hypothetical protein
VGKRRVVSQKTELAFSALAQAEAGQSLAASANDDAETNGAPLAPAIAPAFNSGVQTYSRVSSVRVAGMMSGVCDAVDRVGQVELLMDGVAIGGAELVAAGHVTANIGGSLEWIAHNVPAGVHTFGVRLTLTAGTLTVGIRNAVIVVEQKP